MKKGLELPINMIVIIAIAVLVLVVIAAYFASQTGGGFQSINDLKALGDGCQKWLQTQCSESYGAITIRNYRPLGEGTDQSMSVACTRNDLTEDQCKTRCGCPK